MVQSETLNIPPGATSYDADPSNYRASCPSGYAVIGTGYNAGIGKETFTLDYGGFFVGGFVINDTSITIQTYLQAICGQIPQGATMAVASRAVFDAKYRSALKSAQGSVHH